MDRPNPSQDESRPGGQRFPETLWSMVLAAGDSDSKQAAAGFERLCRAYWSPLKAFVCRRGYSEHEAEDLTQSFFARLLEGRPFHGVVQRQTRFRSFLLTALKNFLADQYDFRHAQKRGGGVAVLSTDAENSEHGRTLELSHEETPEKAFEQRWAITLLNRTLDRLEAEFAAAGKSARFALLRGLITEEVTGETYAQVGVKLGMSEEAVKKAVQRMRRRYQEILRSEIGQTVATASEIEEELRHLWTILGR